MPYVTFALLTLALLKQFLLNLYLNSEVSAPIKYLCGHILDASTFTTGGMPPIQHTLASPKRSILVKTAKQTKNGYSNMESGSKQFRPY